MELSNLTSQILLSEMFSYILDQKLAVLEPQNDWMAAFDYARRENKGLFSEEFEQDLKALPTHNLKSLIRLATSHHINVIYFRATPRDNKITLYYREDKYDPKKWLFLASMKTEADRLDRIPIIYQKYYVFDPFVKDKLGPFREAKRVVPAAYRRQIISHYAPNNDWNFPSL
jgi:hypothetical protein